jgi:Integral membrane protein|tara:strand:- start:74 stop:556 length:483 start_codon:yes stop_codon:yes gene_type:complete
MIKIQSNKENNFHRILIKPNQSISWKSGLVFVLVIAFTCLSIGLGFAYVGATLILPFAGLEVIFVGICTYLVLNKTSQQEVITLSKDKLIIEKGAYRLKKVWEYFRLWSYITVERPQHPWYPAHIVVTSKGERVPLGDFLTEQEKEELVSSLESIINDLR